MKLAPPSSIPSPIIHYLRNDYFAKKKKNKHYSISAYARDLGISQPFLSRMLNQERSPTVKVAIQIAAVLGISSKLTDEWISSIILTSPKHAKISKKIRTIYESKTNQKSILNYEIDRFKAISQWYHLAILYLTYTQTFKSDPQWIAKRLGITSLEARDAFARLEQLGMIQKKMNRYVCVHDLLVVDAKKSQTATREFQKQMTQKALQVITDNDPEKLDHRLFSSVTFAINIKRLPEFKEKLKAFQKEILEMLESPTYSDVYHLNLQLFPLTKPSP